MIENRNTILVTGAAGFIGFSLSEYLLKQGFLVCGIDNVNDYYDVQLKQDRLKRLYSYQNFSFHKLDISDWDSVSNLFESQTIDAVVHLAAQAGVRYSITHPAAYSNSNLVGFLNILEACRAKKPRHLIYASSSSVYGANTKIPFSVQDNVDHPVSLYAATKKANELMAHTYSHLYGLPTTGVRFFTVYGPWGRPDMAYFKFVKAIEAGQAIDVYNHGRMKRDFTYIDDVVEGLARLIDHVPTPQTSRDSGSSEISRAPYKIYNIGNNSPVELSYFIKLIETALGKPAQKNMLPMQPGDVLATYADVDDLMRDIDFKPTTPIEEGIDRFVQWYRDYYSV